MRAIEAAPSAASTPNHSTVIGPNSLPTAPVPRAWIANSPIRIAIVSGTIQCSNAGVATEIPSTADRTDIAGVRIASP